MSPGTWEAPNLLRGFRGPAVFGELGGLPVRLKQGMPERSFGRTVRFRRTKLGLSQARLGELVGRSASTVRAWERDKSIPREPSVLHALSVVLGVDERSLFEKAGQEPPIDQETSPTLEEALATLTSPDAEVEQRHERDRGEAVSVEHRTDEVDLAEDDEVEVRHEEAAEPAPTAPTAAEPGYVKPAEPYLLMPTTPRFVEPSYVEDANQRQLYRVRNLATLVVAVALVIALIWALSESLGALGSWWDEFFGSLRL